MTRTAFPLGGLVWLALASHLCGCGGDPSGPAEDDPPPIVPCYHADFRCWEQLSLGTNMLLPLYRTHPIKGTDTTVVRAIIVVHGAGRTADSNFRTMVETVFLAGKKEGTLVISPHFQTEEDGPDPAELTWTSGGWICPAGPTGLPRLQLLALRL